MSKYSSAVTGAKPVTTMASRRHGGRPSKLKGLNAMLDSLVALHKPGLIAGDTSASYNSGIARYIKRHTSMRSRDVVMGDTLAQLNIRARADEEDEMIKNLSLRLTEKKKLKQVLQTGLESARASEKVLRSQVASERKNREMFEKEAMALEAELDNLDMDLQEKEKKAALRAKEAHKLSLQVKDLNMVVGQMQSKQRKAENGCVEAERRRVEFQRELIAARASQIRLREKKAYKEERLSSKSDALEQEKDKLMRHANETKIKAISLKKNFAEKSLEMTEVKDQIAHAEDSINDLKQQMAVNDTVRAQIRRKLEEEEFANKELSEEVSAKSRKEMELHVSVKTVAAAKERLMKSLKEKSDVAVRLNTDLNEIQERTREQEKRLAEKLIEVDALMTQKSKLDGELKLLNIQLEKEHHNLSEVGKKVESALANQRALETQMDARKDRDFRVYLDMREMEDDARRLKEKMAERTGEEKRLKAAIYSTEDKIQQLEQMSEDVKLALKQMTDKLKNKKAQYLELDEELEQKTKEFKIKMHEMVLKKQNLKNEQEEKREKIEILKEEVVATEERADNLTVMLEQAADMAEKQRQSLLDTAENLTAENRLLTDELNQEKQNGQFLENDMITAEKNMMATLAQLNAQDKTAAGLARLNTEDKEMFLSKLKDVTNRAKDAKKQITKVNSNLAEWNRKLAEQNRQKEHIQKLLSQETIKNKSLEKQVNQRLNDERGIQSKIKLLHKHNKDKDVATEELVTREGELKMFNDKLHAESVLLKQELRELEMQNAALEVEQQKNHAEILDLERQLQQQEEDHQADATQVKLNIVSLQEGLTEKVTVAEELVTVIQNTQKEIADLQSRLDATEHRANESKTKYESYLRDVHSTREELSTQVDESKYSIAVHNEKLSRREARVKSLEGALKAMESRTQVRESDVDTKRREMEMIRDQYEKKAFREKDMLEVIGKREDETDEIRLELRDMKKREEEWKRKVDQAKFENSVLKKQLSEKAKSERWLLTEVEAQTLGVKDVKNPGNARENRAAARAGKELKAVLKESFE